MAVCKNCEDEVRWVLLPSGKRIMLDVKPVPNGRYVIAKDDEAHQVTDDDIRLHRPRFRCHWDHCS